MARREPLARERQHPLALIEPDDVAAQVAGEKARSARDVERSRGRELRDRPRQELDILVRPGAVAVGESALAEPPFVVLRRAAVVVRLHRS